MERARGIEKDLPYPAFFACFLNFFHRVLTAWRAAALRCSGVRAAFTAFAPIRATSDIVKTFDDVLTKDMVRDFQNTRKRVLTLIPASE